MDTDRGITLYIMLRTARYEQRTYQINCNSQLRECGLRTVVNLRHWSMVRVNTETSDNTHCDYYNTIVALSRSELRHVTLCSQNSLYCLLQSRSNLRMSGKLLARHLKSLYGQKSLAVRQFDTMCRGLVLLLFGKSNRMSQHVDQC